jgi:hypothetical protein
MSCPEQVFTFSTDHYEHLCIKRPTHLTPPLFIEVLDVKTNRTSLLCGNRNGQRNTELKT